MVMDASVCSCDSVKGTMSIFGGEVECKAARMTSVIAGEEESKTARTAMLVSDEGDSDSVDLSHVGNVRSMNFVDELLNFKFMIKLSLRILFI